MRFHSVIGTGCLLLSCLNTFSFASVDEGFTGAAIEEANLKRDVYVREAPISVDTTTTLFGELEARQANNSGRKKKSCAACRKCTGNWIKDKKNCRKCKKCPPRSRPDARRTKCVSKDKKFQEKRQKQQRAYKTKRFETKKRSKQGEYKKKRFDKTKETKTTQYDDRKRQRQEEEDRKKKEQNDNRKKRRVKACLQIVPFVMESETLGELGQEFFDEEYLNSNEVLQFWPEDINVEEQGDDANLESEDFANPYVNVGNNNLQRRDVDISQQFEKRDLLPRSPRFGAVLGRLFGPLIRGLLRGGSKLSKGSFKVKPGSNGRSVGDKNGGARKISENGSWKNCLRGQGPA